MVRNLFINTQDSKSEDFGFVTEYFLIVFRVIPCRVFLNYLDIIKCFSLLSGFRRLGLSHDSSLETRRSSYAESNSKNGFENSTETATLSKLGYEYGKSWNFQVSSQKFIKFDQLKEIGAFIFQRE